MTLEQRYNATPSINSGKGDAKNAGATKFESTHLVSEKDLDFQPQLGPSGIANDDKSNALFHWNKDLGGRDAIPTVKYAPAGRL
jgi:hypothetical protein